MRDPAGGGFARNASAMFGARAGSALLQATTLLVTARELGPVDYGSLALVVTLRTMTLVIAESGLLLVVVREIARGPRDPLQLWQSVLGLRLAMGAVAALALVLLSLAASDVREVHTGALVAGLSFLPYAFFGVAQTGAQAEGRLGGLAIATLAGAATGLLYTVAVLDVGGGVVALSGSLVVASVASAAVAGMLVPRPAKTLRPRLGPAARRLLIASIPLGVSSALVNVYLYVDLALLSRLGSREEVGLYDTAFRFVQLGILIPAVITAALYGRATGGTGKDGLSGGSGLDVLGGQSGDDHLTGGGGDDKLTGGSGRDKLTGGSGRDLIEGGSGNDHVLARDNARDRVRCGRGRDRVVADRRDKVARRGSQRCERVTYPRRRR